MTSIFAYLVAAYFIGPNLTKVQVFLLTALYIVWQSLNIIGIMGTTQAWPISVALLAEAAPTIPLPDTLELKEPTNAAVLAVLATSTLASLYCTASSRLKAVVTNSWIISTWIGIYRLSIMHFGWIST